MSPSQLRASLALWKRRLAYRRRRHDYWHARNNVKAARWHRLMVKARERVELRQRQLAEHEGARPRIVTATQLGLSFQWVWGGVGKLYRRTGHYTAGPRASTYQQLLAIARSAHAQHKQKGWGGCSYWVMIGDDGTICLMNPVGRKAAHVASNNTGNLGINCPGTTGDKPTKAQKASYGWLVAHAHTRALPKPWRSPLDLRKLRRYVHKDLNATACPGDFVPMYRER